MKSLGLFFVKIVLPIGASWLLWQGVERAQSYVPRAGHGSSSAIETLTPIPSIKNERAAEERFVPKGTETIDPVAQDKQPSASPKDAAASVVTLGWGYRVTETQ